MTVRRVSIGFVRTIPKASGPKVRSYAQRVGMLLWAWNRIHASLADIFAAFIDRDNPEVGLAIWHSLKADTAQRDVLMALLPFQTNLRPEAAEAIEWLVEVTGKLSQHRNDVTHTPMVQDHISWPAVMPDPVRGAPERVKRLRRPDLGKFHSDLTGDLIALSFYAAYVSWEARLPMRHFASPEMPQLRSIPPSEVPLSRSQKDHQKEKQRQKLQQRASRGKSKAPK